MELCDVLFYANSQKLKHLFTFPTFSTVHFLLHSYHMAAVLPYVSVSAPGSSTNLNIFFTLLYFLDKGFRRGRFRTHVISPQS